MGPEKTNIPMEEETKQTINPIVIDAISAFPRFNLVLHDMPILM